MKKINFKIVTLFPDLIRSYLNDALLMKAIQKNLLSVDVTDLRNYSQKKYNSVDDTVFGGGEGMLIQYRPLKLALESLEVTGKAVPGKKVIYLSPQGKPWTNTKAKELLENNEEIILICGRYAGVDQRFIENCVDEEISLGDFVLSGGELGALVLIESMSRFIPGVLGNEASSVKDSFEDGLLEAPQFTKPQTEDDMTVPPVLLSGNHQKISEWRAHCSLLTTLKKRPDLLKNREISWKTVKEFYKQMPDEEKKVLGLLDLEFPL